MALAFAFPEAEPQPEAEPGLSGSNNWGNKGGLSSPGLILGGSSLGKGSLGRSPSTLGLGRGKLGNL